MNFPDSRANMKTFTQTAVLLLLSLSFTTPASAQTTSFAYQGRLFDGATAALGIYDFQFTLYDALTGGSPVARPATNALTSVSNGLFTVTLDFGAGAFDGTDRWLEVGVRTNGSADNYQLLIPRQQITTTPYATRAANFSGAVFDSQLSANIARLNATQTFSGVVSFSGVPSFNNGLTASGGITNTSAGFWGSGNAMSLGSGGNAANVSSAIYASNLVNWQLQLPANMGQLAQPAPRVGWNSWPTLSTAVSEETVKGVADVFYTNHLFAGLSPVIIVDDSWGYHVGVVWAIVTFTNAPTNGQTITVVSSNSANGLVVTNTRTWRDTVTDTSTQLARAATVGGAATNLFNINPGFYFVIPMRRGTNAVILEGPLNGGGITVTLSAGYGTVSYQTNGASFAYRDGSGVLRVDTNRFPNCLDGTGMRYLADYCHARGLRFGLYGQFDSVTIGAMVGQTNAVLDGTTYGNWGVDYVKMDGCGEAYDPGFNSSRLFAGALAQARGAPFNFAPRYNHGPGFAGIYEPWMDEVFCEPANGPQASDPDGSWTNYWEHFVFGVTNRPGWIGPGHYAQPDWSLMRGDDEPAAKTFFSAYAMASMAFELGNPIWQAVNASGVFADYWGQYYTNAAVEAIRQDPAVIPCYPLQTNDFLRQIYVKPLGNRASQVRSVMFMVGHPSNSYGMSCSLADCGFSTEICTAEDLWTGEITYVTNTLKATVAGHGVKHWKVTAGIVPATAPNKVGGMLSATNYVIDFNRARAFDYQVTSLNVELSTSNHSVWPATDYDRRVLYFRGAIPFNLTYPKWMTNAPLPATVGLGQVLRLELESLGPGETNIVVVSAQVYYDPTFVYDADTANFLARASITNDVQKGAIQQFVLNAKFHGYWSKCDAVYPFVGGTAASHSKNLVSTNYAIIWNGGVTHDTNGVTGNGSTGYGDTGFNPSTAGGQLSLNSATLFAYSGTLSVTGSVIGAVSAGPKRLHINSDGSRWDATLNDTATGLHVTSRGDFRGPVLASRTGAMATAIYFGTNSITGSDATTGLPNANIYVLAENNGGIWLPVAGNLRLALFGSGFSSGDWANLKADSRALETILGRNGP